MNNTPQLLETPASVPGGAQYQQLACVDACDAVLNCDYAFVAYKETDSNGDWRVRVKSSQTAAAVYEPGMMKSNARSAGAQGKPWFQWGYSFDASPPDPRNIQFRVHVKNGQPGGDRDFCSVAQVRRRSRRAEVGDVPVAGLKSMQLPALSRSTKPKSQP